MMQIPQRFQEDKLLQITMNTGVEARNQCTESLLSLRRCVLSRSLLSIRSPTIKGCKKLKKLTVRNVKRNSMKKKRNAWMSRSRLNNHCKRKMIKSRFKSKRPEALCLVYMKKWAPRQRRIKNSHSWNGHQWSRVGLIGKLRKLDRCNVIQWKMQLLLSTVRQTWVKNVQLLQLKERGGLRRRWTLISFLGIASNQTSNLWRGFYHRMSLVNRDKQVCSKLLIVVDLKEIIKWITQFSFTILKSLVYLGKILRSRKFSLNLGLYLEIHNQKHRAAILKVNSCRVAQLDWQAPTNTSECKHPETLQWFSQHHTWKINLNNQLF